MSLVFSIIIILLFGLAVGSFLNVLIFRLPKDLSILKLKRSFCPKCKKQLRALHLVPLFSFLFLKGKCAFCQAKISRQYFMVELATAVIFVLVLLNSWPLGLTIISMATIIRDLFFATILIIIFCIDLKDMLILDIVIYPVLPIAFLLNWGLSNWSLNSALFLLIGGAVGYLFYWLQYYFSKGKWVGAGDMKLAALIGVMLSLKGLAVTLFLAYVGGAIIAIILILLKKKKWHSQLPMAVFLCPAALVVLLCGQQIIQWYFDVFIW